MQKIMVNVVKQGDVVYDLGANNGLHGLLMSGLVGPTGKVCNFEPFEGNAKEIVENYAFNNITNYENIIAAVSDKNGKEIFYLGDHHKQGAIMPGAEMDINTIEVATLTLDSFIESGNPPPAFIKMDIEGAEGRALKGFSKYIDRYLPLMIIELHTPEQDREVGLFLQAHGYSAYRFDTFKKLHFTPITDFSKVHPAPEGIWGSLFCLPPGKKLDHFTFEK